MTLLRFRRTLKRWAQSEISCSGQDNADNKHSSSSSSERSIAYCYRAPPFIGALELNGIISQHDAYECKPWVSSGALKGVCAAAASSTILIGLLMNCRALTDRYELRTASFLRLHVCTLHARRSIRAFMFALHRSAERRAFSQCCRPAYLIIG